MKPLNWKLLGIPLGVFSALGAVITHLLLVNASTIPAASWLIVVLTLGMAGALLFFGLGVRATEETPARFRGRLALATAIAANSSAWTAAVMTGWYVGITLPLLNNSVYINLRAIVAENLVCALGSLVLLVVAVIVEKWCRLADDDESSPRAANPTTV